MLVADGIAGVFRRKMNARPPDMAIRQKQGCKAAAHKDMGEITYLRLRSRHIDICAKLMTSCAKAGIDCRIPARQAKLHLP
ncbi:MULTISPECIES: hypothetical protein [Ensifer]|jgi:hypothetical protein|uniref:Uncharacterized protein n=1 Tax=Ensifer canadensis TaxID=555315 RepID=A0AAW4FSQ1_9HYPH|nr:MULTISPECIES: hypothetical protein [Ensifer]MDP9627954.1 hypothetical protein [Ensifer adhaerens]MBD9486759.1 hypothetical protein [Ensifer sp. ENS11]MBM3094346.1 hypothetical protein [Ensifer canadensis]NOV15090.1 hypothetical protein [Ensifer canadensis]UBI76279.1 hypothetical protein J3R84_03760 [Ensifer canadensis]